MIIHVACIYGNNHISCRQIQSAEQPNHPSSSQHATEAEHACRLPKGLIIPQGDSRNIA